MSDDLYDDEPHPAEKRIEARENKQLKAENAILKAGLSLSDDQREALLAVVKDDLSLDTVKAKAEALGFIKTPEAPVEPAVDENLAAEERMSAVAADSTPPPPPASALASVRDKVASLPGSQVYVGSPLYQEALAAITAAGATFGTVEHDGRFQPL